MSRTSFAQHGLVRIAYEVTGEGESVVVLLHGLLSDRVAMRPLADALADQMRVVMVDLRGHGGSSAIHGVELRLDDLAGDVLAVLNDAEITAPVTIVGIEMGAVIGQRLRETAPDRIANLVAINNPVELLSDRDLLRAIADRAYKGQTGAAVDQWLTLSWDADWQISVPKPRIASARRSAAALPQMLAVLADAPINQADSLTVPGGTPFADEADVARVVARFGISR